MIARASLSLSKDAPRTPTPWFDPGNKSEDKQLTAGLVHAPLFHLNRRPYTPLSQSSRKCRPAASSTVMIQMSGSNSIWRAR